jgi:tetratricopeptide (TPR) repeat protein
MKRHQIFFLLLLSAFGLPSCVNENLKNARELLKKGESSQAIEFYKQFLAKKPDHVDAQAELAMAQKNYAKADEIFKQAGRKEYYLEIARAALTAGDNEDAVTYYRKTVKKGTNDSNIYLELGFLLFKTANYKDAKQAFQKALLLKPGSEKAYLGLGKTCFVRLEYEEAIAALSTAIQLKKSYPEAHVGLAEIYLFLEDFEQAAAHYLEAIQINPEYPVPYLGLSIVTLKQKKWNKSLEYHKMYAKISQRLINPEILKKEPS